MKIKRCAKYVLLNGCLLALCVLIPRAAQAQFSINAPSGTFAVAKRAAVGTVSGTTFQVKLFYPGGGIYLDIRNVYAGAQINYNFKVQAVNAADATSTAAGVTCYNISLESAQITLAGSINNQSLSTGNSGTYFCPRVTKDSLILTLTGVGGGFSIDLFATSVPPGTNPLQLSDPCTGLEQKTISVIALAASGKIITEQTSQNIWVCSYSFSLAGTTPTAQFQTGTGATCAVANSNISGAFAPTSGSVLNSPGNGTAMQTPSPSVGVCIIMTGAGASAQGYVTYVQH